MEELKKIYTELKNLNSNIEIHKCYEHVDFKNIELNLNSNIEIHKFKSLYLLTNTLSSFKF